MKTLGYSHYECPSNGIGPFDLVFDQGLNLKHQDNLKGVDAIVLWGGDDISPSLYNEEPLANSGPAQPSLRDLFEWHLLREALQEDIPVIGVCRGAQLVCAFAGGLLIQHINGHQSQHKMSTYDQGEIKTSSSHHQMMFPYNVQHELLAWSEEPLSSLYLPYDKQYCTDMKNRMHKEPEVVYFSHTNTLAIQGHPEWLPAEHEFNTWVMKQVVQHCKFKD